MDNPPRSYFVPQRVQPHWGGNDGAADDVGGCPADRERLRKLPILKSGGRLPARDVAFDLVDDKAAAAAAASARALLTGPVSLGTSLWTTTLHGVVLQI